MSSENCGNPLIQPKILALIKGSQNVSEYNRKSGKYINNFTYDWNAIESLFQSYPVKDSHQLLTYENCVKYVQILRPVWKESLTSLENKDKLTVALSENLYWTGNDEIISSFLKLPISPTFVIEGCLLLTAVLENALGNIFYTITKTNPPHLLRDLLNTQELKDLFTPFPIFFLKIILGTPNSVNLRNILWHGFPAPDDIPDYYLSLLIIVIITFSSMIKEKSFKIIFREKVTLNKNCFDSLQPKICFDHELSNQNIINESNLILKTHKIFWKQIYKYFHEGQYQQFIVLILPQIELILRLIYAQCNQVDVSAKIHEYYIIIDTLFEENVANYENRKNNIFSHLEDGTLKLLYDLFISPNGPRIRDKVSHGEINFADLNHPICSTLLLLTLNLLTSQNNSNEYDLSFYESKFHINSVLFEQLKNVKDSLDKIRQNVEIPNELINFVEWGDNKISYSHTEEFVNLKQIKIFFRPRHENEFITILNKIACGVSLTCENQFNSLMLRFESLSRKELRSRRRKTLENMLKSLPIIYETLKIMAGTIELIFSSLQTDSMAVDEVSFKQTLRFLKQLLKHIENLVKYCNVTSNEWERSTKMCSSLREILDNFQIKRF